MPMVDPPPVVVVPPVITEPPVVCVKGRRLGVWLDPQESGEIRQENYLGSFVAYKGEKTMAENYNYYSVSAHPIVGPTPAGFAAHTFFYEGSDGLGLSFYANVDEGGSAGNEYTVEVLVSNNQLADNVVLSDDAAELTRMSQTQEGSIYSGKFKYWSNTDGGVIGPFVGTEYKIQFRVKNSGDISTAKFYSADGGSFQLKDKNNGISSFIISYLSYEECR